LLLLLIEKMAIFSGNKQQPSQRDSENAVLNKYYYLLFGTLGTKYTEAQKQKGETECENKVTSRFGG
jgi:hypothetical protein